jgi:hypothetical protein
MLRGLSLAARETRTKVHLLLSGWASGEAVLNAFRDASRRFAGNVRVSIVDGTLSENRFAVWQAADIFTSLSDNIQETFGLVILEAMASGLPVVATNWNGYRDLVVDGETGILVPTCMVPDATRDAMLSLLIGEVDYDHYLARTNQCVAVDVWAAAQAYAAFLRDPELRQRCGTAGRRRVEQQFAWRHVIRAYEQQWARQELERTSFVRTRGDGQGRLPVTGYPSIDGAFAGYPSQWLSPAASVVSPPDAVARLAELLETPLCNYEPADRSSDPGVLRDILGQAAHPTALLQLAESLCQAGLSDAAARATLAWLLKYDLLRIAK